MRRETDEPTQQVMTLSIAAYLELFSHAVDEEPPAVLARVLQAHAFDLVPDAVDHVLDLVVGQQIGDLAGRQQIVNQHQELLVGHLRVGHQEHHADVFQTRLNVQSADVNFQIGNAITFTQRHLEFKDLACYNLQDHDIL